MFRKSLIPLTFLFAFALLAAPQTARADGNLSAHGGGHATFAGIQSTRIKFSFSAVRLEDGSADGNALIVFPDVDANNVEFAHRIQADIDSVVFDPSTRLTTLSGIVTKSTFPAAEGTYFELVVLDEGDHDRIAFNFSPFGGSDIDAAGYTVEQGSIHVRPE